jgi:peptidoglycan/LPS O-acetylase OafA/YrhL
VQTGLGNLAHLGVVVFFVISGFLITSLLLNEHQKHGGVSLKLFYARRALRIFPPCYAYLVLVSMLWLAGVIRLHPGDLLHSITYTVNYYPFSSWQIGHLWSLSVEEQFYLLWPLIVVLLRPDRAVWGAVGLMVLAPFARSADWLFLRGTPYYDLTMFPMVADSLAAGCLLAKLRPWLERQTWYLRLFRPAYSFGLLGALFALNRLLGHTIVSVAGMSVMNVILAILIHRAVYRPGDWCGHVLNWKPVAFLGTLSYSLYLWQQLFLNRHSTAWVNAFPQNLVATVGVALASYLLLEKPLLRWRGALRTS